MLFCYSAPTEYLEPRFRTRMAPVVHRCVAAPEALFEADGDVSFQSLKSVSLSPRVGSAKGAMRPFNRPMNIDQAITFSAGRSRAP